MCEWGPSYGTAPIVFNDHVLDRELETAAEQPHDQEQHDGADRGIDDLRYETGAEMDAQSRKQQAGNQRAGNTDDEIADQPKAGAPYHLSGQPARDQADEQNNQNAFIGHLHQNSPLLAHATFARCIRNLSIIARRDDSNLRAQASLPIAGGCEICAHHFPMPVKLSLSAGVMQQ